MIELPRSSTPSRSSPKRRRCSEHRDAAAIADGDDITRVADMLPNTPQIQTGPPPSTEPASEPRVYVRSESCKSRTTPSARPVVVDRPVDAAVRMIRERLLSSRAARDASCLDFSDELRQHRDRLLTIMQDTTDGFGNATILVTGARGSGKTLLCESALHQLQLRSDAGDKVTVVRLSGFFELKTWLWEIARSLGVESSNFRLDDLRKMCLGRAVVFVLDEFENFAQDKLLNTLLDMVHQENIRIAIVCVTSRIDAEKLVVDERVRSRCGFHRFLLVNSSVDFRALLRSSLALEQSTPTQGGMSPEYVAKFNATLDEALASKSIKGALDTFEALSREPGDAADLALNALSRMDRDDEGVVTAENILSAIQDRLTDYVERSLVRASDLEICLVVAMSRLHRHNVNKPSFTAEYIKNEVQKMTYSGGVLAFNWKRDVVMNAIEHLIDQGMIGRVKIHKWSKWSYQLLICDDVVQAAVDRLSRSSRIPGLDQLLMHERVGGSGFGGFRA